MTDEEPTTRVVIMRDPSPFQYTDRYRTAIGKHFPALARTYEDQAEVTPDDPHYDAGFDHHADLERALHQQAEQGFVLAHLSQIVLRGAGGVEIFQTTLVFRRA